MTEQYWIEWCQKQLADISTALLTQGYTPSHIESLNRAVPEFHQAFNGFQQETQAVMDGMIANPEGYDHYEAFAAARKTFLTFTNQHRERFLSIKLAQTA